jgi:hypothetical protein
MLANFLAATRPQPPTVVPATTDAYQQPVPDEGIQTPFSEVGGNFDYAGDMSHLASFDPTLEEQIISTPPRLAQPSSPRTRTGTRDCPASPARDIDEEELMDASDIQPVEKKKYVPSGFFVRSRQSLKGRRVCSKKYLRHLSTSKGMRPDFDT